MSERYKSLLDLIKTAQISIIIAHYILFSSISSFTTALHWHTFITLPRFPLYLKWGKQGTVFVKCTHKAKYYLYGSKLIVGYTVNNVLW